MQTYLRYAAGALGAVAILVLLLAPLASVLVDTWSLRDLESRSKLVYLSIKDQVTRHLASGNDSDVVSLFESLTADEKLLAVGYCDEAGQLLFATKLMPAKFACGSAPSGEGGTFSTIENEGSKILAASFPVAAPKGTGHLVVLHDLSFAERRAAKARLHWALAIAGAGLALVALAALSAFHLSRQWLGVIRQTIAEAAGAPAFIPNAPRAAPLLGSELRQLVRDLQRAPPLAEGIQVEWSPQTLRLLLGHELPNAEVLVVSNREPYIHNRTGDGIEMQIPASGLVAALEPVMRACGGTWVAHGSGSADRETVDAHDRIAVPPSAPAYTLRRVWLSEDQQAGYYYGFANEGLWPLCHISFVPPNFREADWRSYQEVNRLFAEAIAKEARSDDPIILVQDYHFAVLPRLLKERLPRATILTFWHIPWPNAETFSICPFKEEIIGGLLGSTILGFHTQFHCNNFLETVDRFIEARIDRERASVTFGGHETIVRPYPISIEWPPQALEKQASVDECRRSVRAELGIGEDVHIGVGVERFDYTKGVLNRIRAIDELLTRHPEWRGRFVFIQAAAPSRSKLDTYRHLQEEAKELAGAVNAKYGGAGPEPIHLLIRHHEPDEVFKLFRAADVCVVSSLHDGMNLVAKEFVAARDDERGVLVLSQFAGASRELAEALIVNPYDAHGLGEAIDEALNMPLNEQRERMRLMRAQVKERNVYRWAGQMLLDAARVRKRRRIVDLAEQRQLGG
ncbi:MAG: trehalose-6-phosphate synthase [Hyphomicrobium sp.]|uniref:alpha,alpha-trehalose-phosphate synthase (UDP-forming) n=1 Tax=Hyphomicrobium sp. TaxID=82 RepID=UPI00132167C2|nr:trehalose-6-phosphate synthase [Hyphomicrobium sp.]KAB2939509.1 MAG: trehalose-6-phosphate synthase [Hyphomicrobium sp.]MBZ0210104.1 trehalose-6-phosphate synthase [Hyphomicrobium sp.]